MGLKFGKPLAVAAAVLVLVVGARAAEAQNLRKMCMNHFGVSIVFNAYVNSKGQLVCVFRAMEQGAAHNRASGGAKRNFNVSKNPHVKKRRKKVRRKKRN